MKRYKVYIRRCYMCDNTVEIKAEAAAEASKIAHATIGEYGLNMKGALKNQDYVEVISEGKGIKHYEEIQS